MSAHTSPSGQRDALDFVPRLADYPWPARASSSTARDLAGTIRRGVRAVTARLRGDPMRHRGISPPPADRPMPRT